MKRTSTSVSKFDSTAKARRNGLCLMSVTDSIDTHQSGLYFGVPERTWDMLKPLNQSYSPSLLTAFQGFYLLDHVPTEYMVEVEELLKVWLRNEGLLFEGLHENRKSRDTELTVVVTQADYTRVVERTLVLIKQTEDKKRALLGVGETAREEEAKAEQERAKAEQEEAKTVQEAKRKGQEMERSKQMAEKTAQDQMAFQIRMAEIDLERLRLSVKSCQTC